MTKKSLILSLLSLGGIIWTASLKASNPPDTLCLTIKQVDYLIFQDTDAKFLRKDTTFKSNKIKDLNRIIIKQTDEITSNESIVKLKDEQVTVNKKAFVDLSIKYTKLEKKRSLFRTGSLVFGCTTIILTGVILMLVK